MKTVLYTCPFVPPEWIAAHRLRPRRVLPTGRRAANDPGAAPGVCPAADASIQAAMAHPDAAAVVVTTLCDQRRRLAEMADRQSDRPLFRMNVPATWQTAAAASLYRDELHRLGRFLTRLSGVSPAPGDLAATMAHYDDARNALRAAREPLGPRRFAEALFDLHTNGPDAAATTAAPTAACGAPVALVGGPMTRADLALFDLIAQAGARVVLDATETGERTLPRSFDRQRMADDPETELADAYFHLPHPFRRPNAPLYRYLREILVERGVRGIVFLRHLWCDIWHAELARMTEWATVPVLELELTGDGPDRTRVANRLQAFGEMLS